jgi:hypothetical protein
MSNIPRELRDTPEYKAAQIARAAREAAIADEKKVNSQPPIARRRRRRRISGIFYA